MGILKVANLGHPVLRKQAAKVDPAELLKPEMQRFIDDMVETMREYDGIGLAAPQVHVSKQLAVIDGEQLADDPKVPEVARRLLVIVNPVLRPRADKRFTHWEGCLSVPGLRGRVARVREVDVEALDRDGRPQRFVALGYFAAVVQHETDHLGGKVYLDRMSDLSTLAYLREYRHHWDGEKEAIDEPVTGG
jgi:peptide deformylase